MASFRESNSPTNGVSTCRKRCDEAEAITIMRNLEELLTFWGVVLNPIAPLALPKPQEFMYQITNVPFAAATEAFKTFKKSNACDRRDMLLRLADLMEKHKCRGKCRLDAWGNASLSSGLIAVRG